MGTHAAVDPRMSERRRSVTRGRRRRGTAWAIALVVVAAVGWGLLASPLLRVDGVVLIGAHHTTRDEVIEAAGFDRHPNLLTLSPGVIAARLERLPWIERAEVERVLPGTVRVRVIEREAALALTIGAARWTIDDRGRVLARGAVEPDLPVLGGVDVGDLEPGSVISIPAARDALRAWRSLPRVLRGRVRAVFAPTLERITFVLDDGTQVRYGAAEQMKAKNGVLAVLLDRLTEQGRVVSYIDVRVPASPAVGSEERAAPPPSPSPSATG